MPSIERIEKETEAHRTAKAVRALVDHARLPLMKGNVAVVIEPGVASTIGGQHLLCLFVHLLGRMKGIVRRVSVFGVGEEKRAAGVPLEGVFLRGGLETLVHGLSGPLSEYQVELVFDDEASSDISIGIGHVDGVDVSFGADAWRVLSGRYVGASDWSAGCPLGPYMAATFAAAEVFKGLLALNFDFTESRPLGDVALSLLDYSRDDLATVGPDVVAVECDGLAIAGAGAGGTAALYALASFPAVRGQITVVDPGNLKVSNLGRYLMSNYAQVHGNLSKVESAQQFFAAHAPAVGIDKLQKPWHEVKQDWGRVLCAVDTPEARWDVQRSMPQEILEAGVMGMLYAVLRVIPGGWCLECKHPPDPDITMKKRALRWGLTLDEVRRRHELNAAISQADIVRAAHVQCRPVEDFLALLGRQFSDVPSLTECGDTPLFLAVPSQAPTLPFATTAAGIVLAAETVKSTLGIGQPLSNYFVHDLRFGLRHDAHKFKPKRRGCRGCTGTTA